MDKRESTEIQEKRLDGIMIGRVFISAEDLEKLRENPKLRDIIDEVIKDKGILFYWSHAPSTETISKKKTIEVEHVTEAEPHDLREQIYIVTTDGTYNRISKIYAAVMTLTLFGSILSFFGVVVSKRVLNRQ